VPEVQEASTYFLWFFVICERRNERTFIERESGALQAKAGRVQAKAGDGGGWMLSAWHITKITFEIQKYVATTKQLSQIEEGTCRAVQLHGHPHRAKQSLCGYGIELHVD
jgi:hypothetical protein